MSELPEPYLTDRLKKLPHRLSVPGSLPVLYFGSIGAARVATIGLNPSMREYVTKAGVELDGAARRFHTLNSLLVSSRDLLTEDHCRLALGLMDDYFQTGKPIYGWFRRLERVVSGVGLSYERRECTHLDLVQEATSCRWRDLGTEEANELLLKDRQFLLEQLRRTKVEMILCNGRSVGTYVSELVGATAGSVRGILNGRLNLTVATASVGGRSVRIATWNKPLAQAGLTREEEATIGVEIGRVA